MVHSLFRISALLEALLCFSTSLTTCIQQVVEFYRPLVTVCKLYGVDLDGELQLILLPLLCRVFATASESLSALTI